MKIPDGYFLGQIGEGTRLHLFPDLPREFMDEGHARAVCGFAGRIAPFGGYRDDWICKNCKKFIEEDL